MILRNIKSPTDLMTMFEVYAALNDESFLPFDKAASIAALHQQWASKQYIRVIEHDGEIRGWIAASVMCPAHMGAKVLQQTYYVSNFSGFLAAKALVMAHTDLVAFAEHIKVPYVISSCSHMDPGHNMCKILAHRGWETRGYLALWRTSHWKGASDVEPAPLPNFCG